MNRILIVLALPIFLLACSKENKSVEHQSHDHAKANGQLNTSLMLTNSQIILANITTQKISVEPIGQTVMVNGKLIANEQLTEVITSRAAGRIEKLYVKETGRTIQKGEPLYQIYSET